MTRMLVPTTVEWSGAVTVNALTVPVTVEVTGVTSGTNLATVAFWATKVSATAVQVTVPSDGAMTGTSSPKSVTAPLASVTFGRDLRQC